MIELTRPKTIYRGQLLWYTVRAEPPDPPQSFSIIVEVQGIIKTQTKDVVEVCNITGDRACLYVDQRNLFERRIS
jgi:hypothetical protein